VRLASVVRRRRLVAWSAAAVLCGAAAGGALWYGPGDAGDTTVTASQPSATRTRPAPPRTPMTSTPSPRASTSAPVEPLPQETAPAPAAPAPAAPAPAPEPAPSPLAGAVIVVDPGHNGANSAHTNEISRTVDAGGFSKACNTTGAATREGYTEAAFAWDVATRTRALLEGAGATVILTRTNNEGWGPCIDQRGRIAADSGATVLLSIHADAATGGSGFHVITPATRSGWTEETAAPSADLARSVRDAMVSNGFSPADYIGVDGIDERGDLGTLNWAGTPAVIVECGNMRNVDDAAVLSSEDGRQRIAAALLEGVAEYLG
jgi:N-acetylmuramoyl-L-alanine amidase